LTRGSEKLATATERKPESWLEMVERDGHGVLEEERLGYEEQSDELLLMGLRLKEGVDLARWQQLSGRDPDPAREEFLLEHGFIERLGNSRLRCTPSGMLILDSVVADLAC
jgi:oxygen-independent coproporphyrinogen-3 oxidase